MTTISDRSGDIKVTRRSGYWLLEQDHDVISLSDDSIKRLIEEWTFKDILEGNGMTDCEVGKWNGWNGGECPVHPDTVVQVQRRDETREQVEAESPSSAHRANEWDWACDGVAGDIIAFRVVKEHKEQREFWAFMMAGGYWIESVPEAEGAVLFREVLK